MVLFASMLQNFLFGVFKIKRQAVICIHFHFISHNCVIRYHQKEANGFYNWSRSTICSSFSIRHMLQCNEYRKFLFVPALKFINLFFGLLEYSVFAIFFYALKLSRSFFHTLLFYLSLSCWQSFAVCFAWNS